MVNYAPWFKARVSKTACVENSPGGLHLLQDELKKPLFFSALIILLLASYAKKILTIIKRLKTSDKLAACQPRSDYQIKRAGSGVS